MSGTEGNFKQRETREELRGRHSKMSQGGVRATGIRTPLGSESHQQH